MKKPKTLKWKTRFANYRAMTIGDEDPAFRRLLLGTQNNPCIVTIHTKSQALRLSKWLKEASKWLKN